MSRPSHERELLARIKEINKAVGQSEPGDNIIKLLKALQSSPNPSEDTLRFTKAGQAIGKLRSSPNVSVEVKRIAAEIVHQWRKAVETEKSKKKAADSKTATASSSPARTPSSSATAAPFKGDPMTRKWQSDGIDTQQTGDTGRNNIVAMVYNGLAFRNTEPSDFILAKSVEIEKAAYTTYDGVTEAYKKHVRTIFHSMKNKSNHELSKSVLSGKLSPENLVKMKAEELQSEELRAVDAKFKEENMKKAQVPMAEKSISTALECGKCKQKKVSYSQAQTRSADEPMTTFCECTMCGHRWKFS